MTKKRIFELQKQDKAHKGKWHHEAFYATYKAAQEAFIYRDGGFRILEHEVHQ